MSETTPLERRARLLADGMMERNPGMTRQQAKRLVRPHARMQLAVEEFGKSARRFAKAWNESVSKIGLRG